LKLFSLAPRRLFRRGAFFQRVIEMKLKSMFHSLIASLLFGALSTIAAQSVSPALNKPVIDKIDPPNWWADMPSPMLLIHGEHLSGARISVTGRNV